MFDTGMGRGDDMRRDAINRQVDRFDNEQDPEKLRTEIKRVENERGSWLTDALEVQAAVERAKRRLEAM